MPEIAMLPYAPDQMIQRAIGPVADALASARVQAGYSIDDISTATRFSTRFIEAIENGDFDAFAAPVYLLGAVRAFAAAVGVDPETAAASVRDQLDREETHWRRSGWIS